MTRRLAAVAAALLVGAAGCGSGGSGGPPTASVSSSAPGTRRTTTATIHVLSPKAGESVAPKVVVRLRVDGAEVLDPNDVTATAGGHVHLYVDGKLILMTRDLVLRTTLKPGAHNLRAEFVAPDHQPFLNPVSATVAFEVHA
jgi:uncharacterized protein YfaQ (DUF2300 family)